MTRLLCLLLHRLPLHRLLPLLLVFTLVLVLLLPWREVQAAASPVLPPPRPAALAPAPAAAALTVFRQHNNTEQRAQVGTTAVLHCVAQDLGDTTVSWVRKRDYHLLTVGSQAYSSDERFQVRYVKAESDWQLHIRYVQARDDGVYECQVASHPPTSLLATLHVHEATSEILGGPEKYVTVGSSLRLVCVLRDNTQPPSYVFWYHHNQMINYHTTRQVRVENSEGLSVLFLSNVRPADSGNYTCAPSNTRPAHIIIHVLKGGETPAAIHSGAAARDGSVAPFLLLLLLLALLPFSQASRHLPSKFSLTATSVREVSRRGTTHTVCGHQEERGSTGGGGGGSRGWPVPTTRPGPHTPPTGARPLLPSAGAVGGWRGAHLYHTATPHKWSSGAGRAGLKEAA